MSNFFTDLVSGHIAPTPIREARSGIVMVAILTVIVIWRVDDLALQILVPAVFPLVYGIRIAMSAARQKRRREDSEACANAGDLVAL